jgi:hypothetical protein
MEMYRKRKILLLVLAACIVFSVVSAETLIADEHDHICTGHSCHVCLQIEIVKCFLRTLNLAGFILLFVVFFPFFSKVQYIYNKFFYYMLTPVALKVRFNS